MTEINRTPFSRRTVENPVRWLTGYDFEAVTSGRLERGEIANQRWVAGRVKRNHQWAGEACAECLGGEVERLALGAFLTEVAVIREAQLEGEHRRGEGDEQRGDTDGVPPRAR